MNIDPNPVLPAAYDIVWSMVVIIGFVLMVIALVSISRAAKSLTTGQALIWSLVVVFLPVIGSLSWLFIGRRSATAPHGVDSVPAS
jgi:hypothetical protein